jgi:uncharacterized damage-inducible protein DinB
MRHNKLYLITDVDGFTPQIGRLVSMMNYVRHTTLEEVTNLTTDQLDYLLDEESNSIGALLSHIAAVEVSYQIITFEDRGMNEEESKRWGVSLKLGTRARREIRGRSLDHYLKTLADVREKTLAELARRRDDWLYEETPFWEHRKANNYFKWFHVFEDELNHRGQIRLISKRLPEIV